MSDDTSAAKYRIGERVRVEPGGILLPYEGEIVDVYPVYNTNTFSYDVNQDGRFTTRYSIRERYITSLEPRTYDLPFSEHNVIADNLTDYVVTEVRQQVVTALAKLSCPIGGGKRDVPRIERLVAAQLVTGQRSMSPQQLRDSAKSATWRD